MRSAPLWNRSALVALAFGLLPATPALAEYRNGARFDPNLPDAATTILRLYNRGMRQ